MHRLDVCLDPIFPGDLPDTQTLVHNNLKKLTEI
jgi:hypothetical protein